MSGPLQAADCALLEADDPDAATDAAEIARRQRRLRFYLRNGLLETGVTAVVFRVTYRILELPVSVPHSIPAVRGIYQNLYRHMLPECLYRTMVDVR